MTSVIAPVIPPRPGSRKQDQSFPSVVPVARRRVPVPPLPVVRDRASFYGFAAVDDRGRIASGAHLKHCGRTALERGDEHRGRHFLPHALAVRNIELFARTVLPELKRD